MKLAASWFRCLIACILFCTLFAAKLFSCVRSLAQVEVPANFSVSVLHEGQPVPGIQVAVYEAKDSNEGAEKPILRMVTSSDGRVQISDLDPGKYVVATEGPGRGSAVYAIVATTHPKPSSEIKLEWPYSYQGILKSRTLAGELISNDPWNPFENIHLELWTAGLPVPLAVEDTGADGRFRFNETQPGIYVLRIHGYQKHQTAGNQIAGEVPVELSPSGPDNAVSLLLDMTDCGIEYSNCQVGGDKPVIMASRRIQVLYIPGRAEYPTISGARYKLLNERGVSVAEGTTDENGMAELPSDVTGRTTLVVASPLMTTLKQNLDLLTLDSDAPKLAVTLGGLDECSTVSLEKHATAQ